MTRADFLPVFNRLAVALREPADDTGVTLRTYYDALCDLSLEAVELGATALTRESGRRFFPTTGEWRDAAMTAHGHLLRKALPPARTEPWKSDCARCEDTCWVFDLRCPETPCERAQQHQPHTYTKRCHCWPTNPTWRRHAQIGYGAA